MEVYKTNYKPLFRVAESKKHQLSYTSLEGLRRHTGNEVHFRPIPSIWHPLMGLICSLQCLEKQTNWLCRVMVLCTGQCMDVAISWNNKIVQAKCDNLVSFQKPSYKKQSPVELSLRMITKLRITVVSGVAMDNCD